MHPYNNSLKCTKSILQVSLIDEQLYMYFWNNLSNVPLRQAYFESSSHGFSHSTYYWLSWNELEVWEP